MVGWFFYRRNHWIIDVDRIANMNKTSIFQKTHEHTVLYPHGRLSFATLSLDNWCVSNHQHEFIPTAAHVFRKADSHVTSTPHGRLTFWEKTTWQWMWTESPTWIKHQSFKTTNTRSYTRMAGWSLEHFLWIIGVHRIAKHGVSTNQNLFSPDAPTHNVIPACAGCGSNDFSCSIYF